MYMYMQTERQKPQFPLLRIHRVSSVICITIPVYMYMYMYPVHVYLLVYMTYCTIHASPGRVSAAPTRPVQQQRLQQQRPLPAVTEGQSDFIYDATDAWNYYKRFVQV